VLLAVCGVSPQVLTETLYALSARADPFVPTEIHVVTTLVGQQRIHETLLPRPDGYLWQLGREWGLDLPDEGGIHLHLPGAPAPLADVRDQDDNRLLADAIIELVRHLTSDRQCAVHASIAGGRKTMGFYTGYAMSLLGRPQDGVSHVLVDPRYEGSAEFYFPTREQRWVTGAGGARLDASKAEVTLGELPIVMLRSGLPEDMLEGEASFSETVSAAQRALGRICLSFDIGRRVAICGTQEVRLAEIELAFYLWLARRQRDPQVRDDGRANWRGFDAAGFARAYEDTTDRRIEAAAFVQQWADKDPASQKAWFEQRTTRLKGALIRALGTAGARVYGIQRVGAHSHSQYRLHADLTEIHAPPAQGRPGGGG
jgi:CRISPR-associated protein (TIGR02584 family)